MPAPRFSARLRPLKLLIAVLGTLAAGTAAAAGLPSGYPADYQGIVDAATKEGKVVIYSTTDAALANPLVQAFEAR